MKIPTLIMFSLYLSGCVGLTTNGKIAETQCNEKGELCFVEHWLTQRVKNPPPFSAYAINLIPELTTKKAIVSLFGEPDRVVISKSEKLYYKLNRCWRGVTVWAGIGIPLNAPIGQLFYIFEFKDGKLVDVIKEKNGRNGCYLIGDGLCW